MAHSTTEARVCKVRIYKACSPGREQLFVPETITAVDTGCKFDEDDDENDIEYKVIAEGFLPCVP